MCAALAAVVFAVIATVAGLRATHPPMGRIDPGNVRWNRAHLASSLNYAPLAAHGHRGRPPCRTPYFRSFSLAATSALTARLRGCPVAHRARKAARSYSERCCGIPASKARTSVSRYRRWPPSVRIDVSLPAFAHRVTVFGSTLNIVATSAGVSSGSASGVRADMCTASPPGPVLRSCVLLRCLAPLGSLPWMSHMVYSETILPSPAVTSRPPGAKFLC